MPHHLEPQPENLAANLDSASTAEEFENAVRRIAEETGAHPETLRLALQNYRAEAGDQSFIGRIKRQWTRLNAATKMVATSAFLGMQVGLAAALGDKLGDKYGLFAIAEIVLIVIGIFNLALAKRRELGALAGAAFGFAGTLGTAFFSLILAAPVNFDGFLVIPFTLLGALAGALVSANSDRLLKLRLQHDPEKRREELLKQLIELQDELRQNERVATFLSVDVEGSRRIKEGADALSAEYTFTEYTNFVVACAKQFGGELHSTAGDGVLLVFDHPDQALNAAKRIQAGMLEFNAFRNRTGAPFILRCGIHTGAVVAPGRDVRSVAHSHVIDLAAHAQKQAPAGGVAITEDATVFLPGGAESIGEETADVHGKRIFIWRSAAATATGASHQSAAPPPPRR